jgi:hypothetical protein
MEQRARRKPNWTLQAILCAGVACGLIGGVGALVMLARGPSRPG